MNYVEPGSNGAAPYPQHLPNIFPAGLIGEVAQFLYEAAPRPVAEIALAGAIGFLAGITGRAYNVSGTGLNQYLILLAPTGVGKEAIASGIGKLKAAIFGQVPSIIDFIGPGDFASATALIRTMEKQRCCLSISGEFGLKLKQMASPNAKEHLASLSRGLLQFYSKSGFHDTFDVVAFADEKNNTKSLASPALTIIGESVPSVFYEALDESLIAGGLLPRCMVFEYFGRREYLNANATFAAPDPGLVQRLADLTANCLTIMAQGAVCNVALAPDALEKSSEFDRWTTDTINANRDEVSRQLWNRAHLKALKLAALRAVGENALAPQISLAHMVWAADLIAVQSNSLIARFANDQVGNEAGSESKQHKAVIREIAKLVSRPFDNERDPKFGVTFEMHRDRIVPQTYLSRKLLQTAAFKDKYKGGTGALVQAIKSLLDGDELREMPQSQMLAQYQTKCRAFAISNPTRFIDAMAAREPG